MPTIVHKAERGSNGNSLKYSPDARFANENTRERCRRAGRPMTAFRTLPLDKSTQGSVEDLANKTNLFTAVAPFDDGGPLGVNTLDDFIREQYAAGSGANLAYHFGKGRVPRGDEFPFFAVKRGRNRGTILMPSTLLMHCIINTQKIILQKT